MNGNGRKGVNESEKDGERVSKQKLKKKKNGIKKDRWIKREWEWQERC